MEPWALLVASCCRKEAELRTRLTQESEWEDQDSQGRRVSSKDNNKRTRRVGEGEGPGGVGVKRCE